MIFFFCNVSFFDFFRQESRARADHQAWLRELEVAEAAADVAKDDSDNVKDKQQRPSTPRLPWPEPDFYRIHIVGQDGVAVGSGVDSDGTAPVHTLDHGTIVVAYERCVLVRIVKASVLWMISCDQREFDPFDEIFNVNKVGVNGGTLGVVSVRSAHAGS